MISYRSFVMEGDVKSPKIYAKDGTHTHGFMIYKHHMHKDQWNELDHHFGEHKLDVEGIGGDGGTVDFTVSHNHYKKAMSIVRKVAGSDAIASHGLQPTWRRESKTKKLYRRDED